MVNHVRPNSACAVALGQATAKQLATVRSFSPCQSCEDHFYGENDNKKDKSVRKKVEPLGTLLSAHQLELAGARLGTRGSFRRIDLGGPRTPEWASGDELDRRPEPSLGLSVADTMRLLEMKVDHYLFARERHLSMVGSANRRQMA